MPDPGRVIRIYWFGFDSVSGRVRSKKDLKIQKKISENIYISENIRSLFKICVFIILKCVYILNHVRYNDNLLSFSG